MLSRVNCHCRLPQSNYNNYYPDEDVDDVEAAKKQRKNNSEMSEENNNNNNRDIGSKDEPMTNNSGNVSSTSQEQSTLTSTNLAAFDSSSMRSSTHSSTASSRATTTDSDSDRYTRYRDVDAQSIVSHQSNSILLPLDENEENDQVGSRPLDSAPTETFTAGSSGQIAVGLSATTSGVGSNEDNRRSSMETTTESATAAAAANETTSQVGDMMRSMTTIERNERAPRNQQDDGDIEHEDNLDESEWPGANPNEEPDDEDEIVEEHPPRPRASSLPSRNNENQPSTIPNTLETTASSTSAASQGSTEPLIQDDRPHSYSRLTRHIQAYFNVTTAGINNDTQVTLETTGNERGEEERPSATETAAVISRPKSSKFEPKSSLFGSLVSHCNLLTTGSRSVRKSPQSLRHLAELFGHFESYYGVMMSQPMEHYFDTKRPRTCRHHHQKMQLTDDEEDEEVEDENEDDEMSSSKRMRQNSAAVAALDDNARNADNDDEDNGDDSECSSSDDVNSYDNSNNSLDETFTASRGGGKHFGPANNSNSSSLCDLSNYSAPDTTGATTSSRTGGKNALTNEFHLCALCSHILTEPITLICGCTFCKSCLAEYQSSMLAAGGQKPAQQSRQQVQQCPHSHDESMRKRKHDESTSSQPSPKSLRCFTCGNAHEHNSIESIKPNVIITKLVEKYWSSLLEIRHLRNDIRSYICHRIEHPQNDDANFDFDMFDSMLNSAYTLDPSNHLILADLFILNYFNECNQTCLKYAQMACDLRPNWAFGYYLKAVYYRYMGDLASMRKSLLTCLQIEPNIEPIRRKLHQMFLKSTNFSINKSKTTESSISSSSSKKMTTSAAKSKPKSKPKSTTVSTSSSEVSGYHFERPPESINITSMKFDEEKKSDKPVQSLRESTLHFDYSKYVTVDSSAVKPSELECSLCYRLLYHPVTTPCGHTFCLKCLERALDHRSECPLCKHSLDEVVAERRQFVTQFLTRLIRTHYRAEYDERKRQHRDEMLELVGDENELPVFVCTLAMPFAPCPLHIYEPRYRLMIRRAIESGRRSFGMAMYSERTPYRYAEYGCVLDIQTCQFLRDGRSILTTVGNRRFRVVNSGTRDGYNVARVEWVKDVRVDDQAEKTELLQLHDEVYRLAHTWYSHIPQVQKDRIMEIYGVSELPLPEADIQTDNGPYWHWFLLNILPLDRDFQYKFLCKTSLKERLKQMKKILLVIMAPLRQLVANAAAAAANDATSTTSEENSDTNSATSSSPHLQRHNSLQAAANPTTATNIGPQSTRIH